MTDHPMFSFDSVVVPDRGASKITIFMPALDLERGEIVQWCMDRFGQPTALRLERCDQVLLWCAEVRL